MKNKFYLKEFQYFDGEAFITFNIVDLKESARTITLAVTNRGRISVVEYDLYEDDNGLYFEYGCMYEKIKIVDFEEIK